MTATLSPDPRPLTMPQGFKWTVAVNGEMINLVVGDRMVGFHFTVALKLVETLHAHAVEAKKWAGDAGRVIMAAGDLTSAENNYKHGYQ